MNLSDILNIYTEEDLDSFVRKYFGEEIFKNKPDFSKISNNWKPVGNDDMNAGTIDMLESGEKGIIERLTNAIDAVIEKEKIINDVYKPKKSFDVIKKAYPIYNNNVEKILQNDSDKNYFYDAGEQVILAVNDGSKKTTPTFDICDYGTGIKGENFGKTILSIHGKNKYREDQSYLIGAFGQGGSTSFAFSSSTIIVSHIDSKFYFTIIKKIHLEGSKNKVYLYLNQNGNIIELDEDEFNHSDYLNKWKKAVSGTLVRMINTEISKNFRERDITKPRMLGDYLNIELFDVKFPVQLVERRNYFIEETEGIQNRYSYGSKLKILTSRKHYRNEYNSKLKITLKDKEFEVDYYVILPSNEDEWADDIKCKDIYEQFNLHQKPIIYTANGQYINGENYTKLNNRGLTNLKYRLLVHINLDVLGSEKYDYFTTDRNKIKNTELADILLEQIIKEITNNPKIIEINELIGQKQLKSTMNPEDLSKLTQDLKDSYLDFLVSKSKKKYREGNSGNETSINPERYKDFIESIYISNKKEEYYKNQIIRLFLVTNAYKEVNERALISLFINNNEKRNYIKTISNGYMSFAIDDLLPGKYLIFFNYFENERIVKESNHYSFIILDEKEPIEEDDITIKDIAFDIQGVSGAELIVNVNKNETTKKIEIKYCLNHEALNNIYASYSDKEISVIKKYLVKEICLFPLLVYDLYIGLEVEKKNSLIANYIKLQLKTNINLQNQLKSEKTIYD